MQYYSSLQLSAEPFSNSPDPNLFFPSKQHAKSLQWLEIGVRLKRGLHVVIGEIGTGKTTICRKLLQGLIADEAVSAMLILDPGFSSAKSFLQELYSLFTGEEPNKELDKRDLKEALKSVLFSRAVDNNELLILVVDEGQKLSEEMLEVLRELLNYETNKEKLLQIIIFGQKELQPTLEGLPNLKDRINKQITIEPLTQKETAEFIEYRMRRAASGPDHPVFSKQALAAIHKQTKGYPRKIVTLCHQALLVLTTTNSNKITSTIIKQIINENIPSKPNTVVKQFATAAVIAICLSLATGVYLFPNYPLVANVKRAAVSTLDEFSQRFATATTPTMQHSEPTQPVANEHIQKKVLSTDSNTSTIKTKQDSSFQPVAEVIEPQIVPPKPTPPQLLGMVTLPRGSSLSKMILNIYGSYSKEVLEKVLSVNPHITKPNEIPAKTFIYIPAANAHTASELPTQYWLTLSNETTLPHALDVLNHMNSERKMFRLICAWNPQQGLHFPIVMRTAFNSKEEAQNVLRFIPKGIQHQMTIVQAPLPETYYYNL